MLKRMLKRTVSGVLFLLLLTSTLSLAFGGQSTTSTVDNPRTQPDNSLSLKFDFPSPAVVQDSSQESVRMGELPQYGAPGEPVLPFRLVKVLIPQGSDVQRVEVSAGRKKPLQGRFNVAHGKTAVPISSNIAVVDQPNKAIYDSADPFPSSLFSQLPEQYVRGYQILQLKLFPVQYIPRAGELYYYESMTVHITLEKTGKTSSLFRNLPQDSDLVQGVVDNPDDVKTYVKTLSPSQPASPAAASPSYDYVVITNNALKSSFQTLVNWKIQKGLNATIVLIEDILANPNYHSSGMFGDGNGSTKFNDTQAHIRNFIKDAYLNWGIEYVLLGGDDEIIPSRGVYDYAGNWIDYNIPCDLYYGALDGSWDKDNDTIFGEAVYPWSGPENGTAGEEADFYSEVYVGRATVDTPQEAANFVSKTIAYEQATQVDYLKKALMIGQRLDDITEGGNSKDLVTDMASQYTTKRLYDRDGTYSLTSVVNELNGGLHIVNHDGHASKWLVMGLYWYDVDSLTNTQYFLAYSMGCYSAAFDELTSGSTEAVAEHFIFGAHGAFAYIGNSRYGWYCPGSTDGPGDRYDRSFFSVLGQGITNLGKTLQLSKEQEPMLDRWTYFTLNLLGDPETQVVTAIKAPTAHFETRTDLLGPPRIGGLVSLRGTAKRGTAAGSTFNNFTIQFGQGTNPATWLTTGITLTNGGGSELVNQTLATWNTSQIAAGNYTLRLSVYDAGGLVGEDRKVVFVSQTAVPVYIRADGSVDPATAPIHREGDTYTLTGNVTSDGDGIIIERNNMVLLGAGYTIQGSGGGGAGVCLFGRSNVTIKDLVVRSRLYGVYLKQSSNNTISESSMVYNTHGICLLESSDNTISRSNVTNNYMGISLLSSSNNNSLIGNLIEGNTGTYASGIYLYDSTGNFIHHNILADNSLQVYDGAWDCPDPGLVYPSINLWDNGYPSGGNYWSNYNGTDQYSGAYQNVTGSDGIGDVPYIIDLQNRDRYPLMYASISVHDVAVAAITLGKTVVGRGYCMNISVAVHNQGTYSEFLNVSTYANMTLINRTAVALGAGNNGIIAFTWNTSGFAFGNYVIRASIEPVSGETDMTDNNLTDGMIYVGIPGDVNADHQVNMMDIGYVARRFAIDSSNPIWDPNADITNDGKIDLKDIGTAARHFGETNP